MSDSSNRYMKFEEDHWNDLAEAFIKKYEAEWIDFVDSEYEKWYAGQEWEEDR